MLHFTGVTLAKAGRFEFVHLPYGGPGGIQDLIGGRIAATIYPIGTALLHVQSGMKKTLAERIKAIQHECEAMLASQN
jgi:tripartite-type tricarboxylate transporter receptor subunit TctC